MKRLAAVALVVIGMVVPVCAQHGGSHGGGGAHGGSGGGARGGFSGHSAPASHGGFGASGSPQRAVAPRFGGASGFAGNRARGVSSAYSPAYGMRGGVGRGAGLAYSRDGSNHRRPYRRAYQSGSFYGGSYYGIAPWVGSTGWIGPDYSGYSDDAGYDDATVSPGYGGGDGYEPQPAGPEPLPPVPYQASPDVERSSAVPEKTEAVTLVFKDGRPSEQIHNYILSRSMLSVLDAGHRDIPVDQLDLAATEKANREAGVEFRLPGAGN